MEMVSAAEVDDFGCHVHSECIVADGILELSPFLSTSVAVSRSDGRGKILQKLCPHQVSKQHQMSVGLPACLYICM